MAVEFPGPQPRSTMWEGDCNGICDSRSWVGMARSSANLRYWVALQSDILAGWVRSWVIRWGMSGRRGRNIDDLIATGFEWMCWC